VVEELNSSANCLVGVSVLVVSYNGKDALLDCLRSVPSGLTGEAYEIVVVDNASVDGAPESVRDEFPEIRLIRAERNLGFAGAVNVAAESATYDHLLLLNPDTVVHAGAISRILQAAERDPGHVIYGGRTVLPDGSIDLHSYWALPSIWSVVAFGVGLSTSFRGSRLFDPESLAWLGREITRDVPAVSGSFLLVHQDDWIQLGGFDTRFFMYGEDADLCLRATRVGGSPLFVSEATVTHVGGASSESHADKTVLLMAGKATFIDKHWRPTARELGLFVLQVGVAVRARLATVLGRRANVRQRSWISVWLRRSQWRRGYPARHT